MKALTPLIIFILILASFSGCLGDKDADNDGLPDNIEEAGWSVYVTPVGKNVSEEIHVTSNTHRKDTDGDGLTDFQEWSSSVGGCVTNPRDKDTDGDGLTDYEEIMVYGTDPLHWADDIDKDNGWWNGDYEEIKYYQSRGINDTVMKQFLNNSDVDGDGIKDGNDIDPLSDLRVRVVIGGIKITSDMDDSDDLLEIVFNLVTDGGLNSSTMIYVPVGINYSVNMSMDLDLNDLGVPGEYNNSISLDVIDEDKGLERKPLDIDGFPGMDIVKVSPSGGYAKNDFDIKDISIPWS